MEDKLQKILNNIINKAVAETSFHKNVKWVGERHGSWEWVAHSDKKEPPNDLNRFIKLALTGPAPMYEVEIWAGADNDERFARRLVAAFQVPEDQVETPAILKNITTYLSEAARLAEWLQPIHLTEAYLRPIRTRTK